MAGQIAGGLRRIERELRDESFARLVLRRQQLELVEVADARVHVLVHPLHVRLVPLANHVDLAAPLAVRIAERLEQLDELDPGDARVGRAARICRTSAQAKLPATK